MMLRREIEEMYKKLNTCGECSGEPNNCPTCKNRIPTDQLAQTIKSYGQVMGALANLEGALEVYKKE